MSYETITVEPVSPHIGAEIGKIDLTKPLPNNQVEELHKAFIQYQVIFFRDQKISFEDQKRLALYFGELHHHVGPATESTEMKAQGVSISLSGIPSEMLALVFLDLRQGQRVNVYVGYLNAAGVLAANPAIYFSGRLDVPTINDAADTATVTTFDTDGAFKASPL